MPHEHNRTINNTYERLNPNELSQLCQSKEPGQTLASTYTDSLQHLAGELTHMYYPSHWAFNDPATQAAFHTLYPEASETDRENILLLDSLITPQHYLVHEVPDAFHDMAHGTSIDHFLEQAHRTLPMTPRQIQRRFTTDACRKRIVEGAPRTVQLACAAEALSYGRIGSQHDYDTYINAFHLSTEDTSDVISLCRAASTSFTPEQHVLSYAKPSQIFKHDGTIDDQLIRPEAAYDLFATSFDRAIVSSFDRSPHMQAWQRHNDRIGETIIDDILCGDVRRTVSLKSLADNPRLPNHLMAQYVEPSDVAQAAYTKVLASLSRDLSNSTDIARPHQNHACISRRFGLNSTPFILRENRRYIELMRITADENSEQYQQAQQWMQESDTIDPKLEELFNAYAHHYHRGAIEVYDIGMYGPSMHSTDRDEARRFDEWCTEIFSHREQFRQTYKEIQEYIISTQ